MKFLVFGVLLPIFCANALEHKIGASIGQASLEDEQVNSIAVDYKAMLPVYKLMNNDLLLGLGARFTRVSANELAIYKDDIFIEDALINSANLAFYSEYRFEKWNLGFNIDFFGISSGDNSTIKDSSEKAEPIKNNLLLGGENDKGTLNSEFWLGYIHNNFNFKAGLAHIVVEYEGDNPENEKSQRFFNALFLGFDYTL